MKVLLLSSFYPEITLFISIRDKPESTRQSRFIPDISGELAGRNRPALRLFGGFILFLFIFIIIINIIFLYFFVSLSIEA
jgi:hypothetical protein